METTCKRGQLSYRFFYNKKRPAVPLYFIKIHRYGLFKKSIRFLITLIVVCKHISLFGFFKLFVHILAVHFCHETSKTCFFLSQTKKEKKKKTTKKGPSVPLAAGGAITRVNSGSVQQSCKVAIQFFTVMVVQWTWRCNVKGGKKDSDLISHNKMSHDGPVTTICDMERIRVKCRDVSFTIYLACSPGWEFLGGKRGERRMGVLKKSSHAAQH